MSPRAGFAYDLIGDNRTVLKGYYGRFYFNSADTVADNENPVGNARLRYQFLDANGNRLLDGPAGTGRVPLDPGWRAASSTSTTTSSGRTRRSSRRTSSAKSLTGLSGRVSYVYKNVRDEWVEIDPDAAGGT